MWHEYPYTDAHELNLDWFLKEFKELMENWETLSADNAEFKQTMTGNFDTLENTVQNFIKFVNSYFDNLDVQQEINNKLDAMAADGTLLELIQPYYDQIVAGQNQRIGTLETTAISLQNQINEIVAPEGDPSLTEVANARVDLDGTVYPTLKARCDADADKTVELSDKLDSLITTGKNLFNPDMIVRAGGFLNPANGNIQANTSHGYYEDYIDVGGDFVLSNAGSSPLSGFGLRIIYYDNDKTFISGEQITSGFTYDSSMNRCYMAITPPATTQYIRLSSSAWGTSYTDLSIMIELGSVHTEYEAYRLEIKDTSLSIKAQTVVQIGKQTAAHVAKYSMPSISSATLNDDEMLELPKITFHGNKTYSFTANVTSFNMLRVGNEESYDATWVEIDNTTIYVKRKLSDVAVSYQYSHGLTITDYIGLVITVNEDGKATITISTNGGTWSQGNLGYEGRNGKIQAISIGSILTNATLSYSSNSYRSKVWIIGDSYLSNANNARWGYYVRQWGFGGYAFIGYPGEASAAGYSDFETCLECGCPMYAVWAHGMNNPDVNEVNADWLNYAQKFLDTCDKLGIHPIFCTIPNTPTHLNTYKNAWIKSSGYRYIDCAAAVGAENANSSWYTNMLSSDNVHPDVQGAIALASAIVTECPEIQLSL